MSCGCNQWPTSPNQTFPSNPWAPEPQSPIPAVFDQTTGQIRPLAFGESLPGAECNTCNECEGVFPSSKVMQDAYFDLMRRLTLLEQKYCECICDGTPSPISPVTPGPVGQDRYIVGSRFSDGQLCLSFNIGQDLCTSIPIPALPPPDTDTKVTSLSVAPETNTLCLGFSDGTGRCVVLPPGNIIDQWQSDVVSVTVHA